MPVDLDRQIVFVHIPKTGGTSIDMMFNLMGPDNYYLVAPVPTTIDKAPVHFTWVELKSILPAEFTQRAFKFAFVRNPWDRFLSAFLYHRQDFLIRVHKLGDRYRDNLAFSERELVSLDAFVECLNLPREARVSRRAGFDGHLEPQRSYVTNEAGQIAMDFIGRFEEFDRDVRRVASRMERPVERVLHARRSERTTDYRAYYSSYARDAVASFYSEDIAEFGYGF
jgi:hypothetical protein